MDMWQIFNIFVGIFAVIGAVFLLFYMLLTWYVYYAFKISWPEENFNTRLQQAILWPFLSIMMVSEMVDSELKRAHRWSNLDQESDG